MENVEKIVEIIHQIIQNCNTAFVYSGQCASISQIASEIENKITELSQTDNPEITTLFDQLNKLNTIISDFNSDQWKKTCLSIPVSKPISDLSDVTTQITQCLTKLGITLTNEYDPYNKNLANDVKSLYGIFADPSRLEDPEVKKKLQEIDEYLKQINFPLDQSTTTTKKRNKKSKKSQNTEEATNTNTQEEEVNDEGAEFSNFEDVQSYKIKLSDYTKSRKPFFKSNLFSLYNGRKKSTKEKVTIMIINKLEYSEEKFKTLVNVLTSIHHPNLESFIGADESSLAIITRQNGYRLCEVIQRMRKSKEQTSSGDDEEDDDSENANNPFLLEPGYKTIIAYNIALGMAYLHSLDIIHRDLCTKNILVDRNFNTKITNFANSRFLPEDLLTLSYRVSSTGSFKAPEFSAKENYDEKFDVFAFSGILYELLVEKPPFEKEKPDKIEKKIEDGIRPPLPDNTPTALKDLIELCWSQDYQKRPSFAQILDKMLSESIAFPDDEGTPVVEQFYESKRIKNDDLKECLNLFKEINEMIQQSEVYFFECVRIRSFLFGYHFLLLTSQYATKTLENDEDVPALAQMSYLRTLLEDLKNTIMYTNFKKWITISLSTSPTEITTDIYKTMEDIYIAMTELDLSVTKYEYVKYDLVNDYREIYDYFCQIENEEQKEEIEKFMNERGFEINVTKSEINENIKNLFSQYKDHKLNRDDFEIKKKIGQGTTSIVYKCMQKSTCNVCAIKEFLEDYIENEAAFNYLRREICFLVNLKNKYLIKFLGFVVEPEEPLWIVSEYINGGDLYNAIRNKNRRLTPFQKTKIAFEIAEGMEQLHINRVIHRDLKTSNILIDKATHTPKITDLGYSKTNLSLMMTKCIGTIYYMAPEVNKGCYGFKADVFSFAMILWEMYYEKYPFFNLPKEEAALAIENGAKLPFKKEITPELKDLIIMCKKIDPDERPSFTQIIELMIEKKIAFSGADEGEIEKFYSEKKEERKSMNQDDVNIHSLFSSAKGMQ